MTTGDELGAITLYLKRLSAGDGEAEGPLAEAVYEQLRRMARAAVHRGGSDVSLQPTALVNEVLLELVRLRSVEWNDRTHFFRVAARLLRRRVIDYIRAQNAAKRPHPENRVDLDDVFLPSPDRFDEILTVHEGLEQLAKFDESLAELIELVYFGGVTVAAAAVLRGVSEKTIDRHLDLGRRWLATQFRTPCPSFQAKAASFDRP